MKHTVMIVEDEVDLRDILREVLEHEGFDVVSAGDGGEALALLPKIEHLCLVILDLVMPGVNGWDFFTALRAQPPYAATPVLVTTSSPSRAPKEATAVMGKPLDVDRVVAAVQKHCAAA